MLGHRRASTCRRRPTTRSRFRYAFEDAEDTGASTLDRAIGSASQRQESHNRYHLGLGSWTRTLSPDRGQHAARELQRLRQRRSSRWRPDRQLTFPSLQDGASFRVPQATTQRRFQVTDALVARARAPRAASSGAEVSRTEGAFVLGVFREGRVELVQDFPDFDLNRDGRVDDNDLLFAVTLRSGKPDQDLLLDDCSQHVLRRSSSRTTGG